MGVESDARRPVTSDPDRVVDDDPTELLQRVEKGDDTEALDDVSKDSPDEAKRWVARRWRRAAADDEGSVARQRPRGAVVRSPSAELVGALVGTPGSRARGRSPRRLVRVDGASARARPESIEVASIVSARRRSGTDEPNAHESSRDGNVVDDERARDENEEHFDVVRSKNSDHESKTKATEQRTSLWNNMLIEQNDETKNADEKWREESSLTEKDFEQVLNKVEQDWSARIEKERSNYDAHLDQIDEEWKAKEEELITCLQEENEENNEVNKKAPLRYKTERKAQMNVEQKLNELESHIENLMKETQVTRKENEELREKK